MRFHPIAATLALMLATTGAWAGGNHAGGHSGDQALKHAHAAGEKAQKDWGIAGDPKAVQRTIEIKMTDDMRFTPSQLRVRQGETVKFVIRNAGQLKHEMVIGTKRELDEHAASMAKFPEMEHEEPDEVHVDPGQTGELIWTFNRPGEFDFACLIAGHYQAGMVGKIKVAAR
ncbi:cupredoxin domain-containing protein [Caldimonas brevitalea]|uniref:Plastocyanin n=1 Tax=Caldimonas brevitalea TaxID=413882 RepID=A0A0G3BN60_9BURK|nr:cupredoxin family protein [Caldimonas brevitalea]AKJ29428.1 plastocyanin [Caldimonas brevitalea]